MRHLCIPNVRRALQQSHAWLALNTEEETT